jgi:hypothetical protein
MITDEEKKEKGERAEEEFKNWLDNHNILYFYIRQEQNNFSKAMRETLSEKRPDFLILIPNFGFIFVDVKNREINTKYNSYPIDSSEAKKYSSLQRKFNIHTWFVISNENLGYNTWLWIPLSKVLESGITIKVSSLSGQSFLPINANDFIQIANNDSLERLFQKMF